MYILILLDSSVSMRNIASGGMGTYGVDWAVELSDGNIIFADYLLIPYIEGHLSNGGKSWDICKHLINLVEGIPKAKVWRNEISSKSIKKELNIEFLFKLTSKLEKLGY